MHSASSLSAVVRLFLSLLLTTIITIATTTVAATTTFKIGGLFPITNYAKLGIHRAAAARVAYLKVAAETNTSTLFPGKTFQLSGFPRIDTRRSALTATEGAFALASGTWTAPETPATDRLTKSCSTSQNRTVAIVGPATSSVSVAVALATAVHGQLAVSYSATSPTLSDKSLYPYYCRVVPSDASQAILVRDLMDYYKWRRIGIISTNDDYGRGLPTDFLLLADASRIVNTYRTFTPGDANSQSHLDAIRVALSDILRDRARIILVHAVIPEAQLVLQVADEMRMSPRYGYVFIATDGWSNDNFFAHSDPAVQEVLLASSRGIIGIAQSDYRASFLNTVFAPYATQMEAEFNVSAGYFNDLNIYAPYAYDAVFAVAHVLHKLVLAGGTNVTNGRAWMTEMKKLTFTGVTGEVKFTATCDREPRYDVVNRQDITNNKFVIVGSWNAGKLAFLDTQRVVFFDGTTTVPTDNKRPLVSFATSDQVWITVLSSLLTCMFLGASVVVYRFRDDPQLKARSPALTQVIIGGSAVGVWAAVVFAFSDNSAFGFCAAPVIMFSMAISMTFGTLLGRVYRIATLFGHHTSLAKMPKITDQHILAFAGAQVVYDIVITCIVYGATRPTLTLEPELSDSTSDVQVCTFSSAGLWLMITMVLIPKLVLILAVAYLSFQTRFVESQVFNESKTLTIAVWSETLIVLFTLVVYIAFRNHLVLSLYTFAIGIDLAFVALLSILLLQPFLNIHHQLRNIQHELELTGTTKAVRKSILSTAKSRRRYTKSKLMCQTCGTQVVLPSGYHVEKEKSHGAATVSPTSSGQQLLEASDAGGGGGGGAAAAGITKAKSASVPPVVKRRKSAGPHLAVAQGGGTTRPNLLNSSRSGRRHSMLRRPAAHTSSTTTINNTTAPADTNVGMDDGLPSISRAHTVPYDIRTDGDGGGGGDDDDNISQHSLSPLPARTVEPSMSTASASRVTTLELVPAASGGYGHHQHRTDDDSQAQQTYDFPSTIVSIPLHRFQPPEQSPPAANQDTQHHLRIHHLDEEYDQKSVNNDDEEEPSKNKSNSNNNNNNNDNGGGGGGGNGHDDMTIDVQLS